MAKKAAETVVLVIDEEGVDSLIGELLKGVGDNKVWLSYLLYSVSPSLSLYNSYFISFQASVRKNSAYLIGYFFKNSKLYVVDEAPNMISNLIIMLSDYDSATVIVSFSKNSLSIPLCILFWPTVHQVSWEALARVIGSIPKEVLPSYIKLVRDAVSTSRDKERRKKKVANRCN